MTQLNRLTQKAGESFLKGDKTPYDTATDELRLQIDKLKPWLTQLISTCESFIDISAATKIVDTLQKGKEKMTATDRLGSTMATVAGDCNPCAAKMSSALHTASMAHSSMGVARKTFNDGVLQNYVEALRNFSNTDVTKAVAAKNELERARLDLDSHKNKMKNSKTDEAKAKEQVEVNKFEAEFSRIHQEAVATMKQCLVDFDNMGSHVTTLIQFEKAYYESCANECTEALSQMQVR